MPFPSPTNLAQITGAIWDEFVHLYAQLEGYLRRQHKEDGSHGEITADSLTATGDVTIDGNLTAGGTTHTLGPVDITTATAGAQLTLSDSWRIQRGVASSPLTDTWALEILDLDRNTTTPVFELGYYSLATAYVVIPRATGLALGFKDGSSVDRIKYLAVQDGVYEQGRTAAAGYWTAVTYSAGDFTASSGTWTVDSGDVGTLAYALVGKQMTVAFEISTTDVSATPATLQIAIPGGFTAARSMRSLIQAQDAGGAAAAGLARVVAADTKIYLFKDLAGTAWTATAADNTSVLGQIVFEVQ